MNANTINTKFIEMGSRFRVKLTPASRDFALDIQHDEEGEFFELQVPEGGTRGLEVTVPQAEKRDRHLLLFVRKPDGHLDRFLCGHDERAWFVAAVPGGASSVAEAKESLKPGLVKALQNQLNVPARYRNRRKTAAFIRQGEWFFVPMWEGFHLPILEKTVLRNEPIQRGRGRPHIVAELYRISGQTVYVHRNYPAGLTDPQYRRLIQAHPRVARWPWKIQRRNPRVYARGAVRHPDHATIWLQGWHRVLMNTESETDSMANVAFID